MNFSRRLLEDAYVIRDPFSPTTGHLTLGGQCCLCSKDICVAPVRLNYGIPGLQEIDSSDFRSPEAGISVTDPDGQRAQLLGLGSKWSPTNMLYMLQKDLMRFLQSLSQVCQNQASERKALLAEWDLVYTHVGTPGNSWWGCAARFFKPWPDVRPKNVIFRPVFKPDLKIHTSFFRPGL